MITKKEFFKFLDLDKKISKKSSFIYSNGIDLFDYNEDFHNIISILGENLFTKYGWEHIQGYLQQKDKRYSKQNPMCWDEKTKEPEYWDKISLYNFLIRQEYIK